MHILEKKVRDAVAAGRYALIPFLTAGYPDEDAFWEDMGDLDKNGADVIEIGVPFSDPVADGPVVENASRQVLADGMSLARIMQGLREHQGFFNAGLVLMGYMNPFLQYGFEKLAKECEEVGVSGMIIPDLPYEEAAPYRETLKKHGVALIALVGPNTSEERMKLGKHYGAEAVIVHDEGDIGKAIDECIQIAERMKAEDPRVYVPQQFENIDNMRTHRNHTALEIAEDAGCHIHGFVSGIGTGGTITGIGQTLKKLYSDIEIWAVEPENAAILSGGGIGTHLQMGIGDGLIPAILDREIYDDICIVSDDEALDTARALAREEGMLVGVSSGTNVAAAKRLAKKLGPGKTVVTVLPDTGERYFSTPLFEG